MSEIIQAAAAALPTAHCRDAASPIAPLPTPSVPMTVRVATREDIAFMDGLQKVHRKALGFFPRAQMEAYIDAGNVLVAEVAGSSQPSACSESNPANCKPQAVGYCISKDRYLKRDELGAVFQLCVVPGRQRGFIGANLLREVFERSAYGCKLYCCWCAQDLPANKFWEAMGFAPIAYRAGGKARSSQPAACSDEAQLKAGSCKLKATPRIHIFWQKRIRAGDVTTPYWFPAKTEGGAIREDRIILPIPPGMRWDEELPVLMTNPQARESSAAGAPIRRASKKHDEPTTLQTPTHRPCAGIQFGRFNAPPRTQLEGTKPDTAAGEGTKSVKPKVARVKSKADPAVIQKARDLRDKWMEHVATNGIQTGGIEHTGGKYDVARALPTATPMTTAPRLAA